MAKHQEPDHTSINLIGTGTTVQGEITSKGDIRIDGKVMGKIHSEGKIVIGNTGTVEGEIYCKNADFSGTIKGKADVGELLSLKASSRFNGDIIANKLSIEPGAMFTGTCTMDKQVVQNQTGADKK